MGELLHLLVSRILQPFVAELGDGLVRFRSFPKDARFSGLVELDERLSHHAN